MKILNRRPSLTREQAMGSLPVRNQALAARRTEDGETEITIPLRKDRLGVILSLIFPMPKERKIVLESIGSDVWDMCDGDHNVAQIAQALAGKYKLTMREAEVSLNEFLRRMGKKRLIAFVVPREVMGQKGLGSAKSR